MSRVFCSSSPEFYGVGWTWYKLPMFIFNSYCRVSIKIVSTKSKIPMASPVGISVCQKMSKNSEYWYYVFWKIPSLPTLENINISITIFIIILYSLRNWRLDFNIGISILTLNFVFSTWLLISTFLSLAFLTTEILFRNVIWITRNIGKLRRNLFINRVHFMYQI
jgi:hypothetical protein